MNLLHHVRKEDSGLFRTTIELAEWEKRAGHTVCLKSPGDNVVMWGRDPEVPDADIVHSQLSPQSYHNNRPKFMWMHGEPLSSVANGVSMRAIVDLAPKMDAFIAMRAEEVDIWSTIKRTYLVQKGIDLEVYKPIEGISEKLSGSPSVLYVENWRQQRNPLYLCVAMQMVHKKYPNARLHLYNCNDKKMYETFKSLIDHNKWSPFIRSLQGKVEDINTLYNKADIVVSCLYPLYARSIESLGAGKAFISPGYTNPAYPWHCTLDPRSIADAIIACHENYDKINYRKWAENNHDVKVTVQQSVEIYERYL